MEKLNEFMEKVKADEALQKEFAQIIGEGVGEYCWRHGCYMASNN